jgi:hypothetical protein
MKLLEFFLLKMVLNDSEPFNLQSFCMYEVVSNLIKKDMCFNIRQKNFSFNGMKKKIPIGNCLEGIIAVFPVRLVLMRGGRAMRRADGACAPLYFNLFALSVSLSADAVMRWRRFHLHTTRPAALIKHLFCE